MPSLEFDSNALEDLAYWIEKDRRKAGKILKMIQEVGKGPFEGSGKPEPLKHELSGCWSRRIDKEHRLVYQVVRDKGVDRVRILCCRYHYE